LRGHTFPDTYGFQNIGVVIAGRNPLNGEHPNWQGRQEEILSVPLSPFSLEEVVHYISSRLFSIIDVQEQSIAALYERTQGRPILVGLTVDVLNYQLIKQEDLLHVSLQDFEATLVAQINNLRNPTNWIILFMAHAYHRFNSTLLDWMLKETSLQALVTNVKRHNLEENLLKLSFVRHASTGDDFVLHDEMRRLIIQYCWNIQDPDQSNRREVSRCAIRYYEQELAHIDDKNDPLAQTYTVEMFYHHLYINAEEGLKFFQEHFIFASVSWQRVYARTLLQEARNMSDMLSFDQRCDLDLAEAHLLEREENAQGALDLYHQIEGRAQPAWFARHQSDIYYGMGVAYLDLSNFDRCRYYYEQCLKLEKDQTSQRIADISSELGYVCRRLGELDKAVDYYNQSIALNRELGNTREYAYLLNSMGNLQRLLGNVDEALHYCKIALRLREKLYQQRKSGEVQIGLTLATLGVICMNINDIAQAEVYFQRALKIFERNNYGNGLVNLYNRFGHISLSRGETQEAMKWFQQAEHSASVVNSEAYINSLNKQGRVFTRLEKWDEAAERFAAAISKAREVKDYYQEAESWIDMAEPLERAGEHEASLESLHHGEELAQQFHYYYLLGRSQQLRGNLLLHARRYQEAFLALAEACHVMGQYNHIRFDAAVISLEDRLLEMPEEALLLPIIETLQNISWPEEKLQRESRRFQQMLEKVKSLMLV
jgi:tetratricopeptide (TPR) repeat protein